MTSLPLLIAACGGPDDIATADDELRSRVVYDDFELTKSAVDLDDFDTGVHALRFRATIRNEPLVLRAIRSERGRHVLELTVGSGAASLPAADGFVEYSAPRDAVVILRFAHEVNAVLDVGERLTISWCPLCG